mmetsp:Transcript_30361/g.75960  ORF Transcript_30361/g.75960 Transcript_30361/m.75960 type:complete len:211 (-) Transcript_30361:67-699(-)
MAATAARLSSPTWNSARSTAASAPARIPSSRAGAPHSCAIASSSTDLPLPDWPVMMLRPGWKRTRWSRTRAKSLMCSSRRCVAAVARSGARSQSGPTAAAAWKHAQRAGFTARRRITGPSRELAARSAHSPPVPWALTCALRGTGERVALIPDPQRQPAAAAAVTIRWLLASDDILMRWAALRRLLLRPPYHGGIANLTLRKDHRLIRCA